MSTTMKRILSLFTLGAVALCVAAAPASASPYWHRHHHHRHHRWHR